MAEAVQQAVSPSGGRVFPRLPGGAFVWLAVSCGAMVLGFILLPLVEMATAPSWQGLKEAALDSQVRNAIGLSLFTSGLAAAISFVLGTPLAWFLARTNFPGKRVVESIIDLPIMIPHPVVGIAILGLAGRNHWLGQALGDIGVQIMGTVTGIVVVLTFVGLPFYVNTVKAGFEKVDPRLEKVARSLGAGPAGVFFRVTTPLSWRHMLAGMIMCMARAISEFGAVVIVAYHPMVAPVLMYERFTAYGLRYSQPVAVWLIAVCLLLFVVLRLVRVEYKGGRS